MLKHRCWNTGAGTQMLEHRCWNTVLKQSWNTDAETQMLEHRCWNTDAGTQKLKHSVETVLELMLKHDAVTAET